MKKFLAVFSLLMLVLLTGCLSDKTERDLNATPPTVGETNYQMKTTVNTSQTTYQAGYMEFKYPTDTTNLNAPVTTGIVSGSETITIQHKTDKATLITVTSYENTVIVNDTEIKALAASKISSTATVKETAKGNILFSLSGLGTYSLGTIVDGNTTYYYYIAQITKSLTKSGATEPTNFTYVIKTIVKSDSNTDLRNFEDIIKSLEAKEKSETEVSQTLEKEKELLASIKSFEGISLANDSTITKANNAIEAVYDYVQENKDYVPTSIVGTENRRIAAMQFINTWVIDGDGTIGTRLKSLLGRLEQVYRDNLEGEIAKADAELSKENLKVFKISNISTLESVLGKLIEKRIEQEVIAGYDFGQKINKDIAVENLRQKYSVFVSGVNHIVNHYIECVRVDGLGRNQWGWVELQAVNGILPIMEIAIDYQQYLEVNLDDINYMKQGELKEIAAREYVRKEAIESLKLNNSNIGYDKDSSTTYSSTQSKVKTIFLAALNSVKSERLRNLNEENKDFFIKARTEATISEVNINDLVNCKNKIELTLYNLAKFVKMFDSNVILTNGSYKSLDTIKDSIVAGGSLAQYQGTNPASIYITNANDNYTDIKLEWSNYYVYAADTILKYFDSSYDLDNND